jgi:sodium transport system permease protein
MRRSVVRLIANKEFRDLLRDRRTVVLILVLPAILYPLFGLSGYVFASTMLGKPTVVGIIGADNLPPAPYPQLIDGDKFFTGLDASEDAALAKIGMKRLTTDGTAELKAKDVDVVLTLPPNFQKDFESDATKPVVRIDHRDGDEKSKLAAKRMAGMISTWENRLRELRFERKGLRKDFHQVLKVEDTLTDKPKEKRAADELRDTFTKVFPFILIMWLVAGAIQPAVDMTAGEKERGTMETLLISPAERGEIVVGKFLATTAFAFASVIWNVLWLAGGAFIIEALLAFPIVYLPGLLGCIVLGIPQAMLFSAVCIALGVFAKSTKEGQYYLMPLLLITMPLAFLSMLPGTELTPGMAIIPVTGPMLLQSRLLNVTQEAVEWWYFPLVLGASFLWVSIALFLAVKQFQRESVLFRETGPAKKNPFAFLRRRKTPDDLA